MLIVDKK